MTDAATEPLQQQLFRYAQDLRELMEQQSRLLQRHRKVLQFMGREDQGDDLLLLALLQSYKVHLVTDMHGEIMRASPAAEKAFSQAQGNLSWVALPQLMPEAQGAVVANLLKTMAVGGASGAILHRTLHFYLAPTVGRTGVYDALILRGSNVDESTLYWLLSEQALVGAPDLKTQMQHPLFEGGVSGLMLTDSNRHICAVNPAFTNITGYAPGDVLGKNPRLLSSGLQDVDFYRSLWNDLDTLGSWTGEFFNRRKNGQVFFECVTLKAVRDTANKTVAYMGAFADISHETGDQDHHEILIHYDPLTGLHNRESLHSLLKQSMLERSDVWVLAISVDNFRSIADDLGHAVGDLLLRECGTRLRALTRPGDTLARSGGGVFLMLVENLRDKAAVESVVATMNSAFINPIDVGPKLLVVSVSMGCAGFQNNGADASKLLQQADTAMQMSRRLSGRLCFFAEKL